MVSKKFSSLENRWNENFKEMESFVKNSTVWEINDQLLKCVKDYVNCLSVCEGSEGTKTWFLDTQKIFYELCMDKAKEYNMNLFQFPKKLEDISLN